MKTPAEYREMEFVELLIVMAKLYKPKIYVEIGIKRGHTIKRMAPFVEKAFGIDIVPLELNIPNVTTVQTTSQEFAKSLDHREPFIDMLFIDADHSATAVFTDTMSMLPYVVPGSGLIFLHDTHPIREELLEEGYCFDAWRAANSLSLLSNQSHIEIVTLPGPWAGLSIIRKLGRHHLSWK